MNESLPKPFFRTNPDGMRITEGMVGPLVRFFTMTAMWGFNHASAFYWEDPQRFKQLAQEHLGMRVGHWL